APDDTAGLVQAILPKLAPWSATAPEQRADILIKAAAIMRRRRFELSAWEIFETGKPWREADADVAEAIDFLEFYAREMRRLGQPRRLGLEPGELNHLMFFPRGLVVVISPWTLPLATPPPPLSPALPPAPAALSPPPPRPP